jgi:hypothetical protein
MKQLHSGFEGLSYSVAGASENGQRCSASSPYWTEMDPRRKLESLQVLEKMVGAIGFESILKRSFNKMQARGWHQRL